MRLWDKKSRKRENRFLISMKRRRSQTGINCLIDNSEIERARFQQGGAVLKRTAFIDVACEDVMSRSRATYRGMRKWVLQNYGFRARDLLDCPQQGTPRPSVRCDTQPKRLFR